MKSDKGDKKMNDIENLYKVHDILKETNDKLEDIPKFKNNKFETEITRIYNEIDDFKNRITKLIEDEIFN